MALFLSLLLILAVVQIVLGVRQLVLDERPAHLPPPRSAGEEGYPGPNETHLPDGGRR